MIAVRNKRTRRRKGAKALWVHQGIPGPEPPPESARAPLMALEINSRQPGYPVCGAALLGRQRACSGECRAMLSRRRREQAQGD